MVKSAGQKGVTIKNHGQALQSVWWHDDAAISQIRKIQNFENDKIKLRHYNGTKVSSENSLCNV